MLPKCGPKTGVLTCYVEEDGCNESGWLAFRSIIKKGLNALIHKFK